MNYGKSAYLKVIELEKKISSSSADFSSASGYLEFDKTNLSQSFSDISPFTATFPSIELKQGQEICFEIKATLSALSSGTFNVGLNINNSRIYAESKQVAAGFNDIIIFKTFTSISNENSSFSLDFYSETNSFSATIDDIKVVILGLNNALINTDIEMHAIKASEDKVLVSFTDSDKIYYNIADISAGSISSDDFSLLSSAISHCFTLNTLSVPNAYDQSKVFLLRVDANKNLYLSNCFVSQSETLIDTSVTSVYATACPTGMEDDILIVYIKNGQIYYTSIKNGNILTSKKLNLGGNNFASVTAITRNDSDHIYIIATDKNNSNYIAKSINAKELSSTLENISIDCSVALTKYVDVSSCDDSAVENLSINTSFVVSLKPIYNSLIEQKSVDNISASVNILGETYEIQADPQVIYGVKLDRSQNSGSPLGWNWGTYTDDAVNFSGAYMDFVNDEFVDNGWYSRWPFNQIKPCIVNNGVVVGYLDKTDYSKYENGTSAPITDRTAGNVMVEIPKIYYKLSVDSTYNYVQISNKPFTGACCLAHVYKGQELSKIYVDAYLSCATDYETYGPYSVSGTVPVPGSFYISYDSVYSAIKTFRGNRCEPYTFNVNTLLQCLFTVMFKATDGTQVLGKGLYKYSINNVTTGFLNNKGFCYGTNTNASGNAEKGRVKFIGIEDFFGGKYTYCAGIYLDSNLEYRILDPYNANHEYSSTGLANLPVTSVNNDLKPLPNTNEYVPIKITGINALGFARTNRNINTKDASTNIRQGFGSITQYETSNNNNYPQLVNVVSTGFGNFNGAYSIAQFHTGQTSRRASRIVYFPQEN
ncbi:MAG: hypothetical protein IJS74_00950 [Clostridia bacterium]|nr:hypothetical protein [Clostridia bacterium]